MWIRTDRICFFNQFNHKYFVPDPCTRTYLSLSPTHILSSSLWIHCHFMDAGSCNRCHHVSEIRRVLVWSGFNKFHEINQSVTKSQYSQPMKVEIHCRICSIRLDSTHTYFHFGYKFAVAFACVHSNCLPHWDTTSHFQHTTYMYKCTRARRIDADVTFFSAVVRAACAMRGAFLCTGSRNRCQILPKIAWI